MRLVDTQMRDARARAESRGDLNDQVHRRGIDLHEVVVIVPNQHLNGVTAARGHAVNFRITAHTVGEDVFESIAPLLVKGKRAPASRPSSLNALITGKLIPFVARAR